MNTMPETAATALPPLGVKPIEQLAEEIKREHDAAERSMRTSLVHARAAGTRLIEVKARLRHGEFMPWVDQYCGFSHSTANLYMKIAKEWSTLGNSQHAENLSLREASKLLYMDENETHADAEPDVPWENGLPATEMYHAANRLLKEVYAFGDRLEGGRLYADMALVLADRTQVDELEIDKIAQAFLECRNRVDRCIQALKQHLEKAPVTSDKEDPGLLASVGEERERAHASLAAHTQ